MCIFLFLLINSNKGIIEPDGGFDILRSPDASDFLSVKILDALQSVEKAMIQK